MRHALRPVVVCCWIGLLFLPAVDLAQEAPKSQYSLKEDESRVGTHIHFDQLKASSVALNLPYAQLSQTDKEALHSWWENIAPGDEPPFPVAGLGALYDPLKMAYNAQLDTGDLFAVATVGADGKVVEVKVFAAPSQQMGQLAARLLLLTTFKPAICAGQSCRLEFPLRMKQAALTDSSGIRCSRVTPLMPTSLARDPAFKAATVLAQVEFLPPGKVGEVTILSSSGDARLDTSVLDAYRKMSCAFATPLLTRTVARQQFVFKTE